MLPILNFKNKIYEEKIKTNWIFLLLSKPDLYLFNLIFSTLIVGVVTLSLTYICIHYGWKFKVPTSAHQLVGVAIGLLLVFRTQSSYERWSSASKNFNDIQNSLIFLNFKIQSSINNFDDTTQGVCKNKFKNIIEEFATNFQTYLESENSSHYYTLEHKYLSKLKELMIYVASLECDFINNINRSDVILMQRSVSEIINSCGSCVKIKNTPIPISYALHIKVSIFLYILSLPFGLFSDMGLWSTVMVMFIYYIIAGIEIISKEIENPFQSTPNDLPLNVLIHKIKNISNL